MNSLKYQAVKLRQNGYSYGMIRKELGISLSTLSGWFKDKPFTPSTEVSRRIQQGRYLEGERRKLARLQEISRLKKNGREEIGSITKRDLWMVGLGLWIGEGSKTTEQIRLANSDPRVIALWARWLREIAGFKDDQIFVTLHIYKDTDEDKCKEFWRNVLGFDTVRFGKTQVDNREIKNMGKKGSLPYGTVHLSTRGAGDSDKGVKFYRRFKGWISAILEDID